MVANNLPADPHKGQKVEIQLIQNNVTTLYIKCRLSPPPPWESFYTD